MPLGVFRLGVGKKITNCDRCKYKRGARGMRIFDYMFSIRHFEGVWDPDVLFLISLLPGYRRKRIFSLRPSEGCRGVACEGGLLTRPGEGCRAVDPEGGLLSTTYDKPMIRTSAETNSRKIEKVPTSGMGGGASKMGISRRSPETSGKPPSRAIVQTSYKHRVVFKNRVQSL